MSRHPIETARNWLVALPLLPVLLPAAWVASIGYGLYRGGEIVAGLCLRAADWMSDKVRTTGIGPFGFGVMVYLDAIDLPALLVASRSDRSVDPSGYTGSGAALTARWGWGDHDHSDTRAYPQWPTESDPKPPPVLVRREVRQRGPVALFRTWAEEGEK